MKKRILVTGGSGFFGSHLVKNLVELGSEIFVLTKYNSIVDNVRLVSVSDKISWVEADLRNSDSLKQVSEIKPQIIFHFAAYNHVGDSFLHIQESMQANAVGTAHLMESFEDYEKFIYIATSEVYGFQKPGLAFEEEMIPFPISPYAVGKYSGELFARMKWHVNKKPVVVIRPFNAFGPYQSPRAIVSELILKCLKNEEIKTTEGKQTRDFNFIENLIDGILLAAQADSILGEVLNIGSGQEISVRDLVSKIYSLTRSSSQLRVGALPYRPTEIWNMKANNEKARRILDWHPRVSLDEGLLKTVDWYKDFIKVYHSPDSPLWNL